MRMGLWGLAAAALVLTAAGTASGQGRPASEQERVQTRELPPIAGPPPGEAPAGLPGNLPTPRGTGFPHGAPVLTPSPSLPWASPAVSPMMAPPVAARGAVLSAEQIREMTERALLPQRSPALQEALRQALSASAVGNDELAVARLAALYAAGLVDAVADAGGAAGDPVAQAIQARALLAKGDRDGACGMAARLPIGREAREDLLRTAIVLRLVCDIASGNGEAAALTVALARDRGIEAPFPFAIVDGMAGGGAPKPPPLPKTVAVEDYALMALAKLRAGSDIAERASPALLVYLASDAKAPEAARLAAAERGARLHLVSGEALAQAYRAPHFAQAEIAKLLNSGSSSARQRALLFQAMTAASEPREKAKLVQALAASAGKAGLQTAMAEAMAPELARIAPGPALAAFADTAIRMAALARDAATAQAWLDMAEANAASRNLAGRWRVVLDIAGLGRPGASDAAMQGATELALAGGLAPELQHRLVTVLDALGYAVPIPLWEAASRTPQPTGGYLPETGLLSRLAEASRRGEAGEVLVLVPQALGPEGPAQANLIALGDSVRALKAAGLEQAARGVAFEALLALMPAAAGHG